MAVIITQLEAVVKTMRIREDETHKQIRESTTLVEEAQFERVQVQSSMHGCMNRATMNQDFRFDISFDLTCVL